MLATLPAAAQRHLEALMVTGTYEYQSDFARRYHGEGKAEGKAEAVLAVLDARGVPVPADARTRIVSCTDTGLLDTWIRVPSPPARCTSCSTGQLPHPEVRVQTVVK